LTDEISIGIPADAEGYIVLQCPHCTATFKALAADLNEFEGDSITCVACGLSHEGAQFLLASEVGDVIQAEIQNLVAGMLNKFSADLERSVRGSQYLKVTATGMPTAHVPQLRAITDLAEAEVLCCETKIKLEFSEAASLFYCPFCGQAQV